VLVLGRISSVRRRTALRDALRCIDRRCGADDRGAHVLPSDEGCQVHGHGIPRGMISHAARYPTRHGLPAAVGDSAWRIALQVGGGAARAFRRQAVVRDAPQRAAAPGAVCNPRRWQPAPLQPFATRAVCNPRRCSPAHDVRVVHIMRHGMPP
jgi:hypothetical protein